MHRLTHMYHENKNKKHTMQEGTAIMVVIAIIVITIVRNANQPCLAWAMPLLFGVSQLVHTGFAFVAMILVCIRALPLFWISHLCIRASPLLDRHLHTCFALVLDFPVLVHRYIPCPSNTKHPPRINHGVIAVHNS